MKVERVFRIAPSIVRMILKERPTVTNVVEGYLRPTPERTQFVRLEASGCHLLLQRLGDQERTEERTKLPTEQAEALLDVSDGRVGYRRTHIRLDHNQDAILDRFEQPDGLDLVTVEFDDQHQADRFSIPGWFGPEVTRENHFRRATLATVGAPIIEEVEVNNAAVIALIDTLESAPRYQSSVSSLSLGPNALSRSENSDKLPPVRDQPVLRLPSRVRLPQVGAAALDPRVTEVLDGVAKALESATIEQGTDAPPDDADAHVEIKRASSPAGKMFARSRAISRA
jgi:CYTH domain-containing protein